MTDLKEYKYFGYENGWTKTPNEVKKCDHKKETHHDFHGKNTVICHECKFYYHYDSGD